MKFSCSVTCRATIYMRLEVCVDADIQKYLIECSQSCNYRLTPHPRSTTGTCRAVSGEFLAVTSARCRAMSGECRVVSSGYRAVRSRCQPCHAVSSGCQTVSSVYRAVSIVWVHPQLLEPIVVELSINHKLHGSVRERATRLLCSHVGAVPSR